jgi:adhesin transport system outer membrane protein
MNPCKQHQIDKGTSKMTMLISNIARTAACVMWITVVTAPASVFAQAKDDQQLTQQALIKAAFNFYPSILAAKYEAQATQEDLSAAERQRWPTFTATVESNSGNVRTPPSRGLQIDQTIWDAGRNTARISESKVLSEIGQLKVILQQQELALQVTAAWQSMVGAHQRVNVAKASLERLKKYQLQMQRRVDAEASSRIDLELANSRVQQTEVEMVSAESNLIISLSRLQQLTGLDDLYARLHTLAPYPPSPITARYAELMKAVDWSRMANEHPNVIKARFEYEQAKNKLEAKQAEGWPQLYVRSYQPFGPAPTNNDTGMTTFVGMRYSPGAGFSNFAEQKAMSTRMAGSEQMIQIATRETIQSMQNDREEFMTARGRVSVLEKSVESSALVLDSYQRQFEAGRKQWLDLLNAVREHTQNQYNLADTKVTMMAALYRLQIRTGQDAR